MMLRIRLTNKTTLTRRQPNRGGWIGDKGNESELFTVVSFQGKGEFGMQTKAKSINKQSIDAAYRTSLGNVISL